MFRRSQIRAITGISPNLFAEITARDRFIESGASQGETGQYTYPQLVAFFMFKVLSRLVVNRGPMAAQVLRLAATDSPVKTLEVGDVSIAIKIPDRILKLAPPSNRYESGPELVHNSITRCPLRSLRC